MVRDPAPRRARAAIVGSLVVVGSLASGCSADVGNVFGDTRQFGGAGGAQSGGGSTPGGNGGSSTNDQTATNDATVTADATSTSTDDTTTTMSTEESTATGRPPGPTVECDSGPCDVGDGGACCFDAGNESSTCVENAGSCQTGFENELVALECQTPDDCEPGLICCAHREYASGQAPYDRTQCVAQCNYPDLYLCDIGVPDCPTYQSPQGTIQSVCKQSQLLPSGYYVCGLN
ncbi:MAG: hypothetical protein HOW73_04185 [Polyangiaceae bacterium]|nr:hypothetical protein [Polyangiaceae bacterium]